MSQVAEQLQQIIQNLRSKIEEERNIHYKTEKVLAMYPDEWEIVKECIRTAALYFSREILRAKHDVANWMDGREIDWDYGKIDEVDKLNKVVADLPKFCEKPDLMFTAVELILSLADTIKEKTYADQ